MMPAHFYSTHQVEKAGCILTPNALHWDNNTYGNILSVLWWHRLLLTFQILPFCDLCCEPLWLWGLFPLSLNEDMCEQINWAYYREFETQTGLDTFPSSADRGWCRMRKNYRKAYVDARKTCEREVVSRLWCTCDVIPRYFISVPAHELHVNKSWNFKVEYEGRILSFCILQSIFRHRTNTFRELPWYTAKQAHYFGCLPLYIWAVRKWIIMRITLVLFNFWGFASCLYASNLLPYLRHEIHLGTKRASDKSCDEDFSMKFTAFFILGGHVRRKGF